MGQLRDRMDGDLRLRALSAVTRADYLRCATHFAAHHSVPPAQLGAEDVRRYLLHLIEDLHFTDAVDSNRSKISSNAAGEGAGVRSVLDSPPGSRTVSSPACPPPARRRGRSDI